MKASRILYAFLCCMLIIWVAKFAYFKLTDGFSLSNISSNHGHDDRWETLPLTAIQTNEVDKALNQEYSYLGKGHQAYVFESQDREYVIKFIKFQKYRHHSLTTIFPLPTSLQERQLQRKLHKENKRDSLFKSWMLASSELAEQTQVFFVHINPTQNLQKTLTLYNKCGISYLINLDEHVFLLQRKAEMLETALGNHIATGNQRGAEKLLEALLQLYQSEYREGLCEQDRYIVRNTGIIANRPIHIDVGRFRKNEELKEHSRQSHELLWKTSLLKKWLAEKHPDLSEHFNKHLETITQ